MGRLPENEWKMRLLGKSARALDKSSAMLRDQSAYILKVFAIVDHEKLVITLFAPIKQSC
jgi:hypothetical protein